MACFRPHAQNTIQHPDLPLIALWLLNPCPPLPPSLPHKDTLEILIHSDIGTVTVISLVNYRLTVLQK